MKETASSPRDLILEASGHVLVIGGPGSGKTTIALDKALQRISSGLLPGQAVLFLSFSRAAVARLAEAATTQIPSAQKDQLCLQTFHSFFWDLLRTHGYLLGSPRPLKILLPHDEKSFSNGVKQKDKIAWAAWEERRKALFYEAGLIAFDLFAEKSCELICGSPHIRELIADRFPIIIVDEAQDTGEGAWTFIESLKNVCQIVCLADLEQQIFDHLPGIGPERIDAIRAALTPLEIDLGQMNNRSPGTEIALFARDILDGTPRGAAYIGVSRLGYHPITAEMSILLRKAIAILVRAIRKRGAGRPDSIAVLASTGRDVAVISAALSRGLKAVAHQIAFDETASILASRFAAFLLEPKTEAEKFAQIAEAIDLLADIERSHGTAGGLKANIQYRKWTEAIRRGVQPKGNLFPTMRAVIEGLIVTPFTGEPTRDWLAVKAVIRGCGNPAISGI
jgi:DNA helicase-2/ATP-dependent DNA helicase PcrA